jgi:Flavin containing amine oxidoreductase
MIPPNNVVVPFSVVVIGGGLAGLSAVQTLIRESSSLQQQQQQGHQVAPAPVAAPMHITLLEAKDRLGGRVHTVSLNNAPATTAAKTKSTTPDTDDAAAAARTTSTVVVAAAAAPVVADMGGMYFHGQGSVLKSLQEAFPEWKTTGSGGDSAVPAGHDAIFKVYNNYNNNNDDNDDDNQHGVAARDLTPREKQEMSNLFSEWMNEMQARIHDAFKNDNKNDDNVVDEASSSTHPALLSQWSKEFCAHVLQQQQKEGVDPDSAKKEKNQDLQQHRRMSLPQLQSAGLEFYQRMHFDLDFAISYPNVAMHGFTNDWDCCDLPGDDIISVHGLRALIDAMESQLRTTAVTSSSSSSSNNDNDDNNYHNPPTTLTIRKQTRVERIEYNLDCSQSSSSKACRITASDQSVFLADACICTIPLGVLKQRATLQQGGGGGGLFVPPLPSDKLQALERAGVGTLNTLVVQWNKPIHCYCEKTLEESQQLGEKKSSATTTTSSSLPSAYYLIGPTDNKNDDDNNHRDVDKNTNPLWHGFVFPGVLRNQDDASITQFHFFETENLPFDNLDFWKVQALQVVQAAVGSSGNKNPLVLGVDDIVNVQLSAWHLDPDCLGSYSAPTTRTRGNVDRKILAEPVLLPGSSGGGLYFAGEHTHYEGRFATMDGAYETGIRAARQVLQQRPTGSTAGR